MTPLAQSISAALAAKRMSQAELARRVGCSRETISSYVRGDSVPGRGRAAKIAEALGVELEPRPPRLTVDRVAAAMGMTPQLLRRGLQLGQLSELGAAIPSPSGKSFNYRFYPARVRELVGLA